MKPVNFLYLVAGLLAVLCADTGFAQADSSLAIAYRNPVDFKNNRPAYETRFEYEKQWSGAYELFSPEVKIKKKERALGLWLISDGKYYYLNGSRHGLSEGYVRLKKHQGNYYYFTAMPSRTLSQQQKINNAGATFGLVGTAVAASKVNDENRGRIHQIFDLENARVYRMNKANMQRVLATQPQLLREFNADPENETLAAWVRYMELLNNP